MIAVEKILATAWAIEPSVLELMLAVAERAEERPQVLATWAGRERPEGGWSVRDGVAVVPVVGPIFRRADMFAEISGATSTEKIAQSFGAAVRDPAVHAVVLDIDSPGGEANGIAELATLISQTSSKPVHAYVGGSGSSGAYWLATAAPDLTVAETAQVGSIGVVYGVRPRNGNRLEIVSKGAPNKRLDPGSLGGLSTLQGLADRLEQVFVEHVARNRRTTPEKVLSDFGRGGVLVGSDAVAAGMADRVGTFEGLMAQLTDPGRRASILVDRPPAAPPPTPKGITMSTEATQAAQETQPAASFDVAADPKFRELEAKLAAQTTLTDSLRAEAKASREKAFKAEAGTFFSEMVAQARALPEEREAFVSHYVLNAIDDHDHPAKMAVNQGGKLVEMTRVEALRASTAGRPQHNLFRERVVTDRGSLPGDLRALDHGPDGDARAEKDVAFAGRWAKNGAAGSKV
jgi:capsid assembly protease